METISHDEDTNRILDRLRRQILEKVEVNFRGRLGPEAKDDKAE